MSRFVTAAFLRSREYAQLLASRVPDPDNVDPGESNTVSENYRLRHADLAGLLGVWRWRGVSRHTVTILHELERRETVLDFGGAGGPLGLGSVVVDLAERDAHGEPVRLHSLEDARYKPLPAPSVTCVFTSHALEHIPDLDGVLQQIAACLAPGGLLIAHVPAWTCVRWRAGIHTSPDFAPHVWDFGVEDEAPIEGLRAYANVAARVAAAGLAVELAEYCGDDSIMVMARKAA
jgi:SAM-dependent methyltransferase